MTKLKKEIKHNIYVTALSIYNHNINKNFYVGLCYNIVNGTMYHI